LQRIGNGTLLNPYRWRLVLNGALGGEITQKILIDCDVNTSPESAAINKLSAITDILMPITTTAGSTIQLTIADGRNVNINDAFSLAIPGGLPA